MNTQTPVLTYTYIEVQALLSLIREADIARLLQIYRVLGCEARAGLDANDVLSEVVCKVLAMERAWPKDQNALAYLVETGRSIISNAEKKHVREVATDPVLMEEAEVDPHADDLWMQVVTPPSDIQLAQHQTYVTLDQWIDKIKKLFVGDEDATCFLTQKLAETKKAAILIACKFTDQIYRNVEKRIKDKVRNRFPQGLPWWEID